MSNTISINKNHMMVGKRLTGGKVAAQIKIEASLTKTDFKSLMKIIACYNAKERTALVVENNMGKLKSLIEKTNKVNPKIAQKSHDKAKQKAATRSTCDHQDLGSLGYTHGSTVKCPHCGQMAEVW